jgi:hypothetical protein
MSRYLLYLVAFCLPIFLAGNAFLAAVFLADCTSLVVLSTTTQSVIDMIFWDVVLADMALMIIVSFYEEEIDEFFAHHLLEQE